MAKYKGVEIDLKPTEAMANAAKQGLEWRREFGRGGTDVGVARARQLANRQELSPSTVRRMVSFFARHAVDAQAEGFNRGEEGFPSAGRIAHNLWGSSAGEAWSKRKDAQLDKIDEEKNMSFTQASEALLRALETKAEADEPLTEPKSSPKAPEQKFVSVKWDIDVKQIGEDPEDDKIGVVRGYASTFGNVDRGNDVIARGAFDRTIAEHRERGRPIRMLWQHNTSELIGGFPADRVMIDERGLFVEGRINLDTQRGREAYSLAKQGVLTDFSIGFTISEFEVETVGDNIVRRINDVDLFEVSLVGEPMNQAANIVEVKRAVVPRELLRLASRDRAWDSDAAIRRVREFTNSEEEPSRTYRNAFLFFDEDMADEFGGYKLPIADVIDGELRAVPRAIFAAAGALRGARGGVDIPDSDRPAIIGVLNRYYEAMNLESPFQEERSFRIDDFGAFTPRQLEKHFKSGVVFTGENARLLVAAVKSLMRDAEEKKRDAEQGATDLVSALKKAASNMKQNKG